MNVVSLQDGGHASKLISEPKFLSKFVKNNFAKIMARGLERDFQSFRPVGFKLELQEAQFWLPFNHGKMVDLSF